MKDKRLLFLTAALLSAACIFSGCQRNVRAVETSDAAAAADASSTSDASSTAAASESIRAENESDPEADTSIEASEAEGIIVSYLGPEGTYTEEASKLFFGSGAAYVPQKTVGDTAAMLAEGSCTYAVIPQENTIGGPVYDYLDTLLSDERFSVCGEVELPIRQTLMAKEGTELKDIRKIYSHKQGIIQTSEWIRINIPDAEVIEVSSTAEGARMAASEEQGCAAVASPAAAEVYRLSVLAESIQMNDDNVTRFYVLTTEPPAKESADRMLFTAKGKASDLPEFMKQIADNDISIVSIHDRPQKTTLGSYVYLIECSGSGYREFELLRDLTGTFELGYRGAFSTK